jgi:Tol biopolymer transport system component
VSRGAASARPEAPPSRFRRPAAWLASAAALLALAALLGPRVFPRRRAPVQFRLVSTFPGSHRSPSLSPDGRMMAFIDAARETPEVWVKPLGEGDPIQITSGGPTAGNPIWSPKGDVIVFGRARKGLWSVPPLGGAPRQILEHGSCASFFPDGERLVFDRGQELWVARVDGSEAHRVEGVQNNFYSFYLNHCATVSPDGNWLAYFQPQWGPHGDFWMIPAAGGTPKRLTSDRSFGGGSVFSRDGRSVIVSSARAGSQTLWRVPIDGAPAEPLTTGAGEDVEPALSADGRTLVYTNARSSQVVMLLDARTGASREIVERRTHTNGPVFSKDGARIAFFSFTDQNEQLFTVGTDGHDLRQVTRGLPGLYIMPRFAPDGASLYFFTHEPPSFRRIASEGGAAETVVEGWFWGSVFGGWIDPSGRLVAYTESAGNGPNVGARVRDLATGQEHALAQPISVSSWSPDGRSLLGHADNHVMRCPADGGACETLAVGGQPVPSGDGSRIFFQRIHRTLDDRTLQSIEVWVMGAQGQEPKLVAVLEPQSTLASPIDVSPRDEIVWVQFRRGKEELWQAQLPDGF